MGASRLDLPPPPHAGLALQRYLLQHDDDNTSSKNLLEAIAQTKVSEAYGAAFNRWKEALKGAVFIEAATLTPLAVGLGNSSPIENGLTIHHTYGTPYLPGSAIKGLLRRAAERYGLTEAERRVLFGAGGDEDDTAGYIVFWDGWLEPASTHPYQKDVITVHHPGYYQGGKEWPTDFDDPTPVAFLSVKPGTRFCIALSSASQGSHDWIVRVAEMLEWGLVNLGLGGKTNAGYGYFGDFKRIIPERPKTQMERTAEVERQTQEVLSQAKDASSLSKIDDHLPKLEGLEPTVRRSSLEAIKSHLTTMKRWDLGKNRCQKIQALLEET